MRLRVTRNEEDERTRFNREEWLHVIPPGDDDYDRLYPRRNDSESGHNTIDSRLPGQRAHSLGREGIFVNLITWALFQNSQALALHRNRAGPPDQVAA